MTPRQSEIVSRLAQGKDRKEIAFDLGVSVKTVEYHISKIYERFHLSGQTQLVHWAMSRKREVNMDTFGRLEQAVVAAAQSAAAGKADVQQVGALCQCVSAWAQLSRLKA